MKKLFSVLTLTLLSTGATAGLFSSKQGKTFETRGAATLMVSGIFTYTAEKKDTPIPRHIDVTSDSMQGLTHDNESGWTKCRVPLKGEMTWKGVKKKELVFECMPLSYF